MLSAKIKTIKVNFDFYVVMINIFLRVRVRFGEHTISHSGPDCPSSFVKHGCNVGVQDIDVEKIVTHPSYSSSTYQNDIAIIRLKNKVLENGKYFDSIIIIKIGHEYQ